MLKRAPSFWLLASGHLRFDLGDLLVGDFQTKHQHNRMALSFCGFVDDHLRGGDSLADIQDVLTVSPQARGAFPEAVAQPHLHRVFRELHFVAERQSAGIVSDHGVQVSRDETAKAFTIAISGRRARCIHRGDKRDQQNE
jgi:hypothetical protein